MLVPEIVAAGGGLLFAFDHATIAGKLVLTLLAIVSIFSWSIMRWNEPWAKQRFHSNLR